MEFAMIALGAVKAVGSIVQGQEEKGILRANEKNARITADYKRQDAALELTLAANDADAKRRAGREVTSEQTASFAQSGFGLGGSAGQAIEDSATYAELDAMSLQYKGVLRSRGSMIEATTADAQADAYKAARKNVNIKTAIGAATHLLSGFSSGRGQAIA